MPLTLRLRQWNQLASIGFQSGMFWRPAKQLHLMLVNPATVRALQGHKTDRIDARRIAEYLQYGLLRGSFIPPKPIRELRELTRMRVHIQQDRNRVINRMARLLETVNLKLASVASNIVGASGRAMLRLLASGVEEPARLAECARGLLRLKRSALVQALEGRPDAHFRWMLSELLRKLDGLDEERARLDARLDELAKPYADVLRRLATIPGVDKTTALVLLAEFGTDMTQFPTAGHLASWAGLCPGNAESAGQRFSGRTRKGDRYVRRILVQSAWAASRKDNCFLAALFFGTAQRRGRKKAAVAVAHRIVIIAWHILAESGVEYVERGGDHFDRRNPERTARKLTRRLEAIGYKVTLAAAPEPKPARPRGRPSGRKPGEAGPPADRAVCPKCAAWRIPCIHARNSKLGTIISLTPEAPQT